MNNTEVLEEYFSLFELRGHSQLTITNYGYAFNEFFNFFENKKFDEIKTKDIRSYLREKKKTVKKSTLKNKITIIKTFYKWLKEEKYIKENPAKRIQKPHINDNVRRHLKPEKVELIRLDINDLFDITMFELFLSSGLRVSEFADLDWKDIDFHDREIKVRHGKGDRN
jgi:integrase/recombinase XerD